LRRFSIFLATKLQQWQCAYCGNEIIVSDTNHNEQFLFQKSSLLSRTCNRITVSNKMLVLRHFHLVIYSNEVQICCHCRKIDWCRHLKCAKL